VRNPRFLHVGISYSAQVNISVVDEVIQTEAWDWMRYSWFCYIVWTTSDAETIVRTILRIPGLEQSHVVVCALDVNDGFAFLPPALWEWLKKDRGFGPLRTWPPAEMPTTPGIPPPPKLTR
jgi:hypothetical protein